MFGFAILAKRALGATGFWTQFWRIAAFGTKNDLSDKFFENASNHMYTLTRAGPAGATSLLVTPMLICKASQFVSD